MAEDTRLLFLYDPGRWLNNGFKNLNQLLSHIKKPEYFFLLFSYYFHDAFEKICKKVSKKSANSKFSIGILIQILFSNSSWLGF